jgi:hypothetical protein
MLTLQFKGVLNTYWSIKYVLITVVNTNKNEFYVRVYDILIVFLAYVIYINM